MLKYLVAEYIRNKENLNSVVNFIMEFYRSDVTTGREIDMIRKRLKSIGELEVLRELEKGTFSGAV